MKRALLLLLSLHLLVVSLLPGADTRVLTDVAAAREHRDADHADEGIWDFISDHFLGGEHRHASGDAHHPLPFHHGHGIEGAAVLLCAQEATWQLSVVDDGRSFARPHWEPQAPSGGVVRRCWQPPQS